MFAVQYLCPVPVSGVMKAGTLIWFPVPTKKKKKQRKKLGWFLTVAKTAASELARYAAERKRRGRCGEK